MDTGTGADKTELTLARLDAMIEEIRAEDDGEPLSVTYNGVPMTLLMDPDNYSKSSTFRWIGEAPRWQQWLCARVPHWLRRRLLNRWRIRHYRGIPIYPSGNIKGGKV